MGFFELALPIENIELADQCKTNDIDSSILSITKAMHGTHYLYFNQKVYR